MKQNVSSRILLLLSAFFALLGGALVAFPKNFLYISRFYANYKLDNTVEVPETLFYCRAGTLAAVGVVVIALFAVIALISSFRAAQSVKSGWAVFLLLLAGQVLLLIGLIQVHHYSDYMSTEHAGYYYTISYGVPILPWFGFGVCAVSALLVLIRQLILKNGKA